MNKKKVICSINDARKELDILESSLNSGIEVNVMSFIGYVQLHLANIKSNIYDLETDLDEMFVGLGYDKENDVEQRRRIV